MYEPATRPTLYFIGVTTGQSSIMRVFPAWAEALGLAEAQIRGMDFPLHADPAAYQEAVAFIRDDPLSLGALVTTHKLDLFAACHDLFDVIDAYAAAMGETSCISKRAGRLVCHAKDPISAGLALDAIIPPDYFQHHLTEVFCMGAGGSAIAITSHLAQSARGTETPERIIVSDLDAPRLEHLRAFHRAAGVRVPFEYVRAERPGDNDHLLSQLSSGALVINATGLGKDGPGSPLSPAARFPLKAIAWELNYRGDLVFLEQARAQQKARQLQVEDGWNYFIHGWTQVIGEVFGIAIPTRGPRFDALSAVAATARR
jgi:shikimate 5-dehydrogenase